MSKIKITSFKKVLIANRGEIAVRIIKTLNKLKLKSVVLYTEVDKNAPYVRLANDAVKIENGSLATSYLSIDKMIEVAIKTKCEAVHPGYGFLSENPEFAKICDRKKLIFIGPEHHVIRKMANKREAKEIAKQAGVSCLPGYSIKKSDTLREIALAAEKIGYPIMLKATAGGGGKGMRLVGSEKSLVSDLKLAKSEALSAFGSDEMILEKAMTFARHIEVQVFGDQKGNYIHLGERDCSIQRRNQKVIEEAPAPSITNKLQEQIYLASLKLAKAINYTNAGTVEFIVDEKDNAYFLEMNTRLQVEHPVTELTTGFDLVEMQFRIADGQDLSISQGEMIISGHAIEARLYAEDPRNDFLPSSGILDMWQFSEVQNIRVDSGVSEGQEISYKFDPMLAKIVAYGKNRKESILNLKQFLRNFSIAGIKNNRDFLIDILNKEDFLKANISTAFLSKVYPNGIHLKQPKLEDFAFVVVNLHENEFTVMQDKFFKIPREFKNWSNIKNLEKVVSLKCLDQLRKVTVYAYGPMLYEVEIDKKKFKVEIFDEECKINGRNFEFVNFLKTNKCLTLIKQDCILDFEEVTSFVESTSKKFEGLILSPIHGNILSVDVEINQNIKTGQKLLVVEAMKMQHEVMASVTGKIKKIECSVGSQVALAEILIEMEPE